jgi:signal transduction histidine kinase
MQEEEPAPEPTLDALAAVISHLQNARERDRATLARSLHDDLGGLLVSAVMDLGWIEQHLGPDELRERLSRVRGTLAAAIDLKRNLIEDLRPSLLDNFGLFAAFRWHVKHSCKLAGVSCTEHYPVEELNLRPEALAALFRTMQEMLAVIVAEPGVSEIDVTVEIDGAELLLQAEHTHALAEITDVFARFPDQMWALTQRIDALGGRFATQRHAKDTVFFAHFPLERILLTSSTV